jgi:hypothetical protein
MIAYFKEIAMHMRWHKEGERENNNLMMHLSHGEAWKALDNFDLDFARDARNLRIGLATDGFTLSLRVPHHTLVGRSLLFHTTYCRHFA